MANKIRAEYIKRPLTEQERDFAGLPENHNLIFDYMRSKNLDPEIFYDELIIDYLVAVKQYVTEKPWLQDDFPFRQVLYQRLNGQMMHYWRKYHNGINTLEREAFRLDTEFENCEHEHYNRMEPWWIDPMQNVERYVVEKEFLRDLYDNIHEYAESELLFLIIVMRNDGESNYMIAKKAIESLSSYDKWGVRELTQFINILVLNHDSPLHRLYKDTEKYGNYYKYREWKAAKCFG